MVESNSDDAPQRSLFWGFFFIQKLLPLRGAPQHESMLQLWMLRHGNNVPPHPHTVYHLLVLVAERNLFLAIRGQRRLLCRFPEASYFPPNSSAIKTIVPVAVRHALWHGERCDVTMT